jgi:hypothetical protein
LLVTPLGTGIENPRVGSSILSLGTNDLAFCGAFAFKASAGCAAGLLNAGVFALSGAGGAAVALADRGGEPPLEVVDGQQD